MGDNDTNLNGEPPEDPNQTESTIERGTYEIIRDRLIGHGTVLLEILPFISIETPNQSLPRRSPAVG